MKSKIQNWLISFYFGMIVTYTASVIFMACTGWLSDFIACHQVVHCVIFSSITVSFIISECFNHFLEKTNDDYRKMLAQYVIDPAKADELNSSMTITAGATLDNKFSLAIQKYAGNPCIVIHRCTIDGGWHWSEMNSKTFVAAISYSKLKWIVNEIDERKYLYE